MNANVHSIIGSRIKQIRDDRGMCVDTLAGKIGLSAEEISAYENASRKISVNTLFELGAALGAPISTFFASNNGERRGKPRAGVSLHGTSGGADEAPVVGRRCSGAPERDDLRASVGDLANLSQSLSVTWRSLSEPAADRGTE